MTDAVNLLFGCIELLFLLAVIGGSLVGMALGILGAVRVLRDALSETFPTKAGDPDEEK